MRKPSTCPVCGALIKSGRVTRHMYKVHPVDEWPPPKATIILSSKSGTKLQVAGVCARCGKDNMIVWSFSRSNVGPVLLCEDCKQKAFDASFGKIDAFTNAMPGGGFETNRRRH